MEEIKKKAKDIAMEALERLVIDCAFPLLELKLEEQDPKYVAYFQIFKLPLQALAEKIHDESAE